MCLRLLILAISLVCLAPLNAAADNEKYIFGVLPQRSAILLAEYWNPILDYVHKKSGITLIFKTVRTSHESNLAIGKGEYDFVYSNHIFEPSLANVGYRVILRPRMDALTGQIVVLDASPIQTLKELEGQPVGFSSLSAFAGYAVPMDKLLQEGIKVSPVFCGNQEGTMSQLKLGKVVSAGVNSDVMRSFAKRENMKYRVIWESRPYQNMPIAVNPRVPGKVADIVKNTIAAMADDPEGMAVLQKSADLIKQPPPLGFVPSNQDDYQAYTDFFRHMLVKDME